MNRPLIFVDSFPINQRKTQYACKIPKCAAYVTLSNINVNKKHVKLVAIAVSRIVLFEFSSFDEATKFEIDIKQYFIPELHMIIQMNSPQLAESISISFDWR